MHNVARFFAVLGIFLGACIAWSVLGGVTTSRSSSSYGSLGREVAGLWGNPQAQASPTFALVRFEDRDVERVIENAGVRSTVRERVPTRVEVPVPQSRSDVGVDVHLDRRRRGLVWYALYDVRFDATYRYTHEQSREDTLRMVFPFPDRQALYDDFVLEVDGQARPEARQPQNGQVAVEVPVRPGQVVTLRVAYKSRGMGSWTYVPSTEVTSLRGFTLTMRTDFRDIDFPETSLSPTRRARSPEGETLVWQFRHVVTARTMGLLMPEPIQPGELASALAFSAPVSLFFFFLVIEALARRRRFVLHPLHFAFLAGAFFAFHLLFSYSVDHLEVAPAFALASVTSVFLVVSYLRVLVSARFALVEAALAQLVYLVGFALAHFADGFTGLTVTVLAILTLFLLMQWSARAERAATGTHTDVAPEPSPAG